MKKLKSKINIDDIFEEYQPDSLFDDDRMYKLKSIINTLPHADKTIIILYADYKNMKDVAQQLNVSTATICNQIKRIKKNIIEEYKREN